MSSFIKFLSVRPPGKYFIFIPLGYTLFLQTLTGFPKPASLKRLDANELFIRFSEELFDYPFWLQDLSHLPLFFILGWLWSWQLGPIKHAMGILTNKASLFSIFYAIANEMVQAFIPDRFPSSGDLIMNLFGVSLGLYLHSRQFQKITSKSFQTQRT